ncbi:hypothetical protein ACFQ1E_17520 [Sphingomonas canadensis]|uniref:ComF family protein n=1 Tax=Sphingomonas canadensis TaxID=1219257 RepID=A0ABW3H9I0_9SPHN|nr:hypothetical protein [Sphingomonas canadensis]MCW3837847.1 hypothetical protein [Sphingomonas canadensis]
MIRAALRRLGVTLAAAWAALFAEEKPRDFCVFCARELDPDEERYCAACRSWSEMR